MKHLNTIIIGGGQAGLAVSYHLSKKKITHQIFEKGQIGNSWNFNRWDSFHLITQNWQCQLPGFHYSGDHPEGFMNKNDVVNYIQSYAKSFSPPIQSGVEVFSVSQNESSPFFLETSIGSFTTDAVIIATGIFHTPYIPTCSSKISNKITQIHTSQYRNAKLLPAGSVLVVGSSQSGCQIAEDLHLDKRKVHLCVSKTGRLPRRYRGKDLSHWFNLMKVYDIPIHQHPEGESLRFKPSPHVTGRGGGYTLNLRQLALNGISLYGRVKDADNYQLFFEDDLIENLDYADNEAKKLKESIDNFIQINNISTPKEKEPFFDWTPLHVQREINLQEENITSIIWGTGFQHDFDWIKLPIFNENGYPHYKRGVTQVPGLYFIGLNWMHTVGSGLLLSVGKDAEFIVDHLSNKGIV